MNSGQVNEEELEQRLGLVEMARSWSPRVISKLENAIRSHQDDDLYRFNPVRHAIQTGMAESEAIALFLHATRAGPRSGSTQANLMRKRWCTRSKDKPERLSRSARSSSRSRSSV